jgi:glyoxalase family protein
MNKTLTGLHHITAIAGDAKANVEFYTKTLGLRLVKKTVNFDDPTAYHLYFADKEGTPGTVLTFFYWGDIPRGRRGAGEITATAFTVAAGSLDFWRDRLKGLGIVVSDLPVRFGESGIGFQDPDGMELELIESETSLDWKAWRTESVPEDKAIRGFHSATGTVKRLEDTRVLVEDLLGMEEISREGSRVRFGLGTGGPGRWVDFVVDENAPRALQGAGTVHHIAYATPNDATQVDLRERLQNEFLGVSPVMDRNYFHSIYFREPQGILFEVATEGPGFAVDEPVETLGEALKLPEMYEGKRAEIERVLVPLD